MLRLTIISVLIPFVVAQYPSKIVGGVPTTIEEHPYQLSLVYFRSHICGASIISANKALTAVHCLIGCKRPSALTVRAGSTYLGMGGQVIRVASICQHPDYSSLTLNNDVVVLVLKSSFVFGSTVQPISLVDIGQRPNVGDLATMTGWGRTVPKEASWKPPPSNLLLQLQKIVVPHFSQTICKKAYLTLNFNITDRMICFGYIEGGRTPCFGDSGGPLVFDGKQIGLATGVKSCAVSLFPPFYADLSSSHLRKHIDSC